MSSAGTFRRRAFAAAAAVVVAAGCNGSTGSDADRAGPQVVEVTRGRLPIHVVEGGLLQSASPTIIRNTIEGRNAILEIVPEGAPVKKGDVVVVLDSAALQDRLNLQEIEVGKARSELALAEEALAIQQMKSQEDEATARCKRNLAEQSLKAYREGTMVQEQRRLQSAVMLAGEKAVRARKQADASRRLVEREFIARADLEADEIAEKQAKEEEKLALGALDHFTTWTARSETMKLETDLQVAEIALKRVLAQCRSEEKQKQDVRDTSQRSYELKTAARDKIIAQIAGGTIRAPSDGLVVYAQKDWDEPPIAKGREVREREEIAVIPDLSDMVVEVAVHESAVKKIQPGQKAWVKVDSQPDRQLPGTVSQVAVVPMGQSSRWNPDLKVYRTVVHLEELLDGLKPGMHAEAEILVADLPDAVQVPLQAVHQVGLRSFVYVRDPAGRCALREVTLGLPGTSRVHVVSGLEAGEIVYLVVPPTAPVLPAPPDPAARRPPNDAGLPSTSESGHRPAPGARVPEKD